MGPGDDKAPVAAHQAELGGSDGWRRRERRLHLAAEGSAGTGTKVSLARERIVWCANFNLSLRASPSSEKLT